MDAGSSWRESVVLMNRLPSTRAAWLAAGGDRISNVDIIGGDHYLADRVDLQMRVADEIAAFAAKL
jgi:hypothetical protein